MTERDDFEVRFHAAVGGYVGRVSSDLDPAELAHRIATSKPRRHGFAGASGWRMATIPRRAWVLLLLLAALLSAMVGGMLLAGSQPQRKLPAVVPPVGQLFACPPGSTPDTPGPVDQARPPAGDLIAGAAAFDRRAGRLVALANTESGVLTWTFDVCTNTWTRMHPDREPTLHEELHLKPHLIYDIDSDVIIAVEIGRSTWTYDLTADTWTQRSVVPVAAIDDMQLGWVYDPVSGLVIAVDDREMWRYAVETDTWTWSPIPQAPRGNARWRAFTYDAATDRIVAYGSDYETWLFDVRANTWSRSRADTPQVYGLWGMATYPPAITYDEATARTVVSSGLDIRIAAYDAKADGWEILADVPDRNDLAPVSIPGRLENHWDMVANDPVNGRIVGIGRFIESSPDGRNTRAWDLLALDTRTHQWTVLLEPLEVQATP
jgi:hypothetical protein